MMSICLQSMVDELMVKKSGGSIRKVSGKCGQAAEWLCLLSLAFFSRREGGEMMGIPKGAILPSSVPVSIPRCCAGGWGAP